MAVHLVDARHSPMVWAFVPHDLEQIHPDERAPIMRARFYADELELVCDPEHERALTLEEATDIGMTYGDQFDDGPCELDGMSAALRTLAEFVLEGITP